MITTTLNDLAQIKNSDYTNFALHAYLIRETTACAYKWMKYASINKIDITKDKEEFRQHLQNAPSYTDLDPHKKSLKGRAIVDPQEVFMLRELFMRTIYCNIIIRKVAENIIEGLFKKYFQDENLSSEYKNELYNMLPSEKQFCWLSECQVGNIIHTFTTIINSLIVNQQLRNL
jgi:hypothetical protein